MKIHSQPIVVPETNPKQSGYCTEVISLDSNRPLSPPMGYLLQDPTLPGPQSPDLYNRNMMKAITA